MLLQLTENLMNAAEVVVTAPCLARCVGRPGNIHDEGCPIYDLLTALRAMQDAVAPSGDGEGTGTVPRDAEGVHSVVINQDNKDRMLANIDKLLEKAPPE